MEEYKEAMGLLARQKERREMNAYGEHGVLIDNETSGVKLSVNGGWTTVRIDGTEEIVKVRNSRVSDYVEPEVALFPEADPVPGYVEPIKAEENEVEPNLCQCGCGQIVKKMFKQGHDQRYKGILLKDVRTTGNVDSAAELVRRGWKPFSEVDTMRNETLARLAKAA